MLEIVRKRVLTYTLSLLAVLKKKKGEINFKFESVLSNNNITLSPSYWQFQKVLWIIFLGYISTLVQLYVLSSGIFKQTSKQSR